MSEEFKRHYDAITFQVRGIVYYSREIGNSIVKNHNNSMHPFFLTLTDEEKREIWRPHFDININYSLVELVKKRINNESFGKDIVNIVTMQLWGIKKTNKGIKEFTLNFPLSPGQSSSMIDHCGSVPGDF